MVCPGMQYMYKYIRCVDELISMKIETALISWKELVLCLQWDRKVVRKITVLLPCCIVK